jgi:hypothetical protein
VRFLEELIEKLANESKPAEPDAALTEIDSIACAPESGDFSATASGATVALWSLAERKRVAVFTAAGLTPSLALAGDGTIVVTSTLLRGVQAFDARANTLTWHRADLSRPRAVHGLPRAAETEPRVAIALGEAVTYVVDAITGRELKKLHDVRALFGGAGSRRAVAVGDTGFRVLDLKSWKTVWRNDHVPTHATVAADRVAVVIGGALRVFDKKGELVFAWRAREGSVRRVAWHESQQGWSVVIEPARLSQLRFALLTHSGTVVRDDFVDGPRVLREVSPHVQVPDEAPTRNIAAELTSDGRHLVVADGTVRAVPSGEIVWEFAPSLREAASE